jgi:DNA-binding response OmpR family regulator
MTFSTKRVLVVEDELLVAMTIEDAVVADGHECVGPASSIAGALQLLSERDCDAAILNVFIAGERIDPVCYELVRRGVPFGFATGAGDQDGRWSDIPRIAKPYEDDVLRGLIRQLVVK